MSNISSIISGHNKNLLNPFVTQYGCNCHIREDCPLQNQCLTPNIIYRVHVHCKANNDYKFNVGVAQIPFKERFQSSATHLRYRAIQIQLVTKRCRDTIHHQLVTKVKGSAKINYCPLCLTEKYHLIEYFNDIRLLNKKKEFINTCRHQSKLLLQNLKRNDITD